MAELAAKAFDQLRRHLAVPRELLVAHLAEDGGQGIDLADGLALPAQVALEQARRAGVPNAEEALADVLDRGPRSTIAKAIVRRLGADLAARARNDRAGRRWER